MLQSYTLSITEITTSSVNIKLDFEYPELIGSDGTTQYLTIFLEFSDFEPMWDDTKPVMYMKIPS